MDRPVLKYQGSKFRIAPWIISFFPEHKVYVESFGGAGSVLLNKPRCATEIYNDLSTKLATIFKVLRDKNKAAELKRLLELTPWSRQEYYETDDITDDMDDIEQSRRWIVRSFMGLSAGTIHRSLGGFITKIGDDYTCDSTRAWLTYTPCIPEFTKRLQGVIIENRDAEFVIKTYDTDKTLHYVDPPYVLSQWRKSDRTTYKKVLTDADHESLLTLLQQVKGFVVLSGYDNEIYRDMLKDWRLEQKKTINQINKPRVECLWISPRTWDALHRQRSLFEL